MIPLPRNADRWTDEERTAYRERVAMCLEGGDVSEWRAYQIAASERERARAKK